MLSSIEHIFESTAYLRMPFCTCGHKAVPLKAFRRFTPAQLDGCLDHIKTQVKKRGSQGCKLISHLPYVHGLCLCIGLSAALRWPSASTGHHLMRWCLWVPVNSAPQFEPLLAYVSASAREAIMRVERRELCSAVLHLGHLPALKEGPSLRFPEGRQSEANRLWLWELVLLPACACFPHCHSLRGTR